MAFDFTIRKMEDDYTDIVPHNAAAAVLLNEHFAFMGVAAFTDADVASETAFIADNADVPRFIGAIAREGLSANCPDYGLEVNPPVY